RLLTRRERATAGENSSRPVAVSHTRILSSLVPPSWPPGRAYIAASRFPSPLKAKHPYFSPAPSPGLIVRCSRPVAVSYSLIALSDATAATRQPSPPSRKNGVSPD